MNFLFAFITALALASTSSPTENILKTCLTEVYAAQSKFRSQSTIYGTSKEAIGMTGNKKCEGIDLDFSNVQDKAFTIIGEMKGLRYSIDDGKNIRSID